MEQAILLGADLVLHSATKYMCGHNDALAGAICGAEEHISAIRSLHNVLGGVIDPHVSYAIIRGLKTLQLRVKRSNESAFEIARRLDAHPKISRVWYPGLESHPDHEVAVRQMAGGYGGVISYEVVGGLEDTARYSARLNTQHSVTESCLTRECKCQVASSTDLSTA